MQIWSVIFMSVIFSQPSDVALECTRNQNGTFYVSAKLPVSRPNSKTWATNLSVYITDTLLPHAVTSVRPRTWQVHLGAQGLYAQSTDLVVWWLQPWLWHVIFVPGNVEMLPAQPLLEQLHWLPVRQWIDYKLAVLTHKIRATSTPSYLSDHIRPRESTRQLRDYVMSPSAHRYIWLIWNQEKCQRLNVFKHPKQPWPTSPSL